MNAPNSLSAAEIADRHRRYISLALLAVAVIFASRATATLSNADLDPYFTAFQIAMAVVTIGLFVPVLSWKVRHPSPDDRFVYFSEDGFAAQALIFAQKRSWAITFIVLAVLEALDQKLSHIPGSVLLQVVLAVMLGSMSLLFLYKTWADDADRHEDDVNFSEQTHA